jgi:hypothetical protein
VSGSYTTTVDVARPEFFQSRSRLSHVVVWQHFCRPSDSREEGMFITSRD